MFKMQKSPTANAALKSLRVQRQLSTALSLAQATVFSGWHIKMVNVGATDAANTCMRATVNEGVPLPAVSLLAIGQG
jgi:hypothetical protein